MKRKVSAMTTEEKLQHFTTYAMEEARHNSDVMIRDPYSVFKKTNLSEVARMMISNDYGQVPVHGNKDELLGMIYDVDVLCALTGSK